jgi:hypothetical protein
VPLMHVDYMLVSTETCKCNATKVTFTMASNQFCEFSSKSSDDRGVVKAPGHILLLFY